MASAATPAIANFFIRTSLKKLSEDGPALPGVQLTVWTGRSPLARCNVNEFDPPQCMLEHAKRERTPQRELRHVGDDAEEDQDGTKSWQERNRQFGDNN